MHESNSRHVSVVSVIFCWAQTVRSVNGQEVVSYCSVEGAVGEGITLTEDRFEELQTVQQDISYRTDVGSDESDQKLEEQIGKCNIRTVRTRCSRRVRVPVRYHDILWL